MQTYKQRLTLAVNGRGIRVTFNSPVIEQAAMLHNRYIRASVYEANHKPSQYDPPAFWRYREMLA